MSFCICTLPEIIVIILCIILMVRSWRYKNLRLVTLAFVFIIFILTYVFLWLFRVLGISYFLFDFKETKKISRK